MMNFFQKGNFGVAFILIWYHYTTPQGCDFLGGTDPEFIANGAHYELRSIWLLKNTDWMPLLFTLKKKVILNDFHELVSRTSF